MNDVTVSMWLPVGRANFYSVTANGWQRHLDDPTIFSSSRLDDPDYVPLLQCSVLRRVLEVLPMSFGYDRHGVCTPPSQSDEQGRPIDVTMTLNLSAESLNAPTVTGSRAEAANRALVDVGVTRVTLRVDEHGFYTFTADGAGRGDHVEAALRTHICEVFGGDFRVDRHREAPPGHREGSAAIRRYNGLIEDPGRQPSDERRRVGPPLGALTFFQLNTFVEGAFNFTLSPMVFFERYSFIEEYLDQTRGATATLISITDIMAQLAHDSDARATPGQISTLRHFLAVTSRESLQKIKWSVESVRRSLLDEMIAVLHRQSRLIQLDLGAAHSERTPDLAIGASEPQLRGYVMLAAAKVPLIANIHEIASLAVDHLNGKPIAGASDDPADDTPDRHAVELSDLHQQLRQWRTLLDGVVANVDSLERAVEQAWMERLLYEQQQSRSEQEAMAEIERSRFGARPSRPAGGDAYSALQLFLALVAVLFAFVTTDLHNRGDDPWWRQVGALWPVIAIAAGVYLVPAVVRRLRGWSKARSGVSEFFSYEFAFRLDERTDPVRVNRHLRDRTRKTRPLVVAPDSPGTRERDEPVTRRPRRRTVTIVNTGGGRIERISPDQATVKTHSVAVFRVRRLRYARFEIINEILINRVSDEPRYFLHQSRMFGVSPVPLDPATLLALITVVLREIGAPLAADTDLDDDAVLDLVAPLFTPPQATRRG